MVDFRARKLGEPVLLTWRTESETNLKHFEVERSLDQANWSDIGIVSGAGNTTVPQNYRMLDHTWPQTAHLMYYRLKMVDLDGSHTFSEIRTVRTEGAPFGILVWPNPSQGDLYIEAGEETNAALYDLQGKKVWEAHADGGSFHLKHKLAQWYLPTHPPQPIWNSPGEIDRPIKADTSHLFSESRQGPTKHFLFRPVYNSIEQYCLEKTSLKTLTS